MVPNRIDKLIKDVTSSYASLNSLVIKNFYIGKSASIQAAIIYNKLLSDNKLINNNILKVLMLDFYEENIYNINLPDIIIKKYLTIGETYIENNTINASNALNNGSTILIIEGFTSFIIINTSGGEFRSIDEPKNESAIRGSRAGFVENIETNLSLIKRGISDKSLTIENFTLGRRSNTKTAIIYIKNLADDNIVEIIKNRLNKIDVDFISGSGMVEQYIEDSTYSLFPQILTTERPDIVVSALMDGRVALIVNGTPFVLIAPTILINFFQAGEDYYERTLVSSFTRIIRLIATFIVILLTPIYLTLIRYNTTLIPTTFILPIAQSRQGIAMPPLLEILSMELIVEFLREGGLRLPPKIAQTLSIVGGIIIGTAALQARITSPTTLLMVGASTACSFLIPNYEMALAIRLIKFIMLFLADGLGFLGIGGGFFILVVHLLSLKSFSIPYFSLNQKNFKDIFIRAALWKMKERPEAFPSKDIIRQANFRNSKEGDKNE